MAKTVKGSGEFGRIAISDWRESQPAAPILCWRGINIGSKEVVAAQCAIDALQVVSSSAARISKAGDNGVGDRCPVTAKCG